MSTKICDLGACSGCDMLVVLAGTGLLLMYQNTDGLGRDPVTEQLRSTMSPGERETGLGEMNGPEGIAEKKLCN